MGLPNQKAGAGGLEEASTELGQGELRLPAGVVEAAGELQSAQWTEDEAR